MSELVLGYALKQDTTSSTAAATRALNPTVNWTDDSQVPRHLYTSLTAMCSGSLNDIVFTQFGTRSIKAGTQIIVQADYFPEAGEYPQYFDSNDVGDEKCIFRVEVKVPVNSPNWLLVRDIGLRIVYILDLDRRSLENNQYMLANSPTRLDPIVTVDNTLDPNSGYKIKHIKSTLPTATEQIHWFMCDYTRIFV